MGDARWAQRLVHLVDRLSEHPAASIPQACGTWAKRRRPTGFLTILRCPRKRCGRLIARRPCGGQQSIRSFWPCRTRSSST
ncbi:MAG: transposase [Firmicutes bacterium]|nr:transposase [Bacillota bacterium]